MGQIMCLTLGGIVGTWARYLLSGYVYALVGTGFPYGTLLINVTGCFLIGFFATLADERFLLSPNMRVMLMTGFCGAFTTFSTFILETNNLIKDTEWLRALGNVLLSVCVGFFLFRVGAWLGKIV